MIHEDEPSVTSNIANVISNSNLQQKHEEKQEDLNKQKGTEIELSSITPQTSVIPQNTDSGSRLLLPFQKENMVVCIMFKSQIYLMCILRKVVLHNYIHKNLISSVKNTITIGNPSHIKSI